MSLIRSYGSDELVLLAFQWLLDPDIITGISEKRINKATHIAALLPAHQSLSLRELFAYLRTHPTGTDYDIAVVQEFLSSVDDTDVVFYKKLISRTHRCGVDAKTVNEAFGKEIIRVFEVQLAQKYFEFPEYVKGKEFTLTQKLDGIRCVAIKKQDAVSGDVVLYSRQGKRIIGLTEIEHELLQMPGEFVLDGELVADMVGTSAEGYKATTKVLLSDGKKEGVIFHVFDILTVKEYESKSCDHSYIERRQLLEKTVQNNRTVQVLPVLYAGSDIDQIGVQLEIARSRKQEGIMININDAVYHFGRTKDLLKVKVMQDADLLIIGFEEGRGALKGTLGALVVDYKGNPLSVGSGYTMQERKDIWSNKDKLLGRVITVQYFEETQNVSGKYSLRFPVFLRLREPGKEPSLF